MPLTRSAPFDEIPADMETLFAEIAPSGARPVEVTVTIPERDGRRCVMDIVVTEAQAAKAFRVAFEKSSDLDGFEVTARRFAG